MFEFLLRYRKQLIWTFIFFIIVITWFYFILEWIKNSSINTINSTIEKTKEEEKIQKKQEQTTNNNWTSVDLLEKKENIKNKINKNLIKEIKDKEETKNKWIKTSIYNNLNIKEWSSIHDTKKYSSKDKTNIYIAINWLDNKKLKILNNYLSKARIMIWWNYNFIMIESKHLDKKRLCLYSYRESKYKKSIWPFQRKINVIYSELLSYFNKNKEHDSDKLIIFNNNNLNLTCNTIKGIKANIDKVKKNNKNVIIFDNKNISEVEKQFLYNLSAITWTYNVNYDSDLDFRNKLNDYIYPLEDKIQLSNKNSSSNDKINTLLTFYDKDWKDYQWNLTIYKKIGWIFKPIKTELVKKAYKWKLDAWIYKFVAYDPVTKVYLETKPHIINKKTSYEHKFIFRKTKLIIRLLDENKKPILGEIYLKWLLRKDTYIKKFNNVSNLVLNLLPGDYKITVKTKNNFIFNQDFKINGEDIIEKQFITVKQKVKVKVIDQNKRLVPNVLITVLKDWELYDTKKGNELLFKLQLWKYTIRAIDSKSWNMVSKYFEINEIPEDMDNIKIVTLILESYPVKIDLWKKWYIVKLYNSKSLMKSLTKFSWTWIKTINLSPNTYILKVYDKNWKYLFKQRFTVDDFFNNMVKIEESDNNWF